MNGPGDSGTLQSARQHGLNRFWKYALVRGAYALYPVGENKLPVTGLIGHKAIYSHKAIAMKKQKPSISFPLTHPHACGIDVGSRSHWACIGEGEGQVREFKAFTEDLHELCKWLLSKGVQTVAMESTGFYWKQLFLMLQSYGLEAILVNAAQAKHAGGKKSDVLDCQWLWRLHSAGLLTGSYQPDSFTEQLRTYNRHRKSLIEDASRYISKMQKALVMMNIQLPLVLSDITGKSGQLIIRAILNGERDGRKLASYADPRVKADKRTIAKALTGFWQPQHLFELRQCWQAYQFLQEHIAECDQQIEALLQQKVEVTGQAELVYEGSSKKKLRRTAPRSTQPDSPTR